MLGMALGCIHLSYDDFCRLTPVEFEHVYKEYRDKLETDHKDDWARMRMLAAIVVQPHLKKKITPQQLLPFPWEGAGRKPEAGARQPTAAESLERFEELARKAGGQR